MRCQEETKDRKKVRNTQSNSNLIPTHLFEEELRNKKLWEQRLSSPHIYLKGARQLCDIFAMLLLKWSTTVLCTKQALLAYLMTELMFR